MLPYLLNDLKKNHIFCCLLFCCCIQKPTNTKKKLTTTTTKIKYILNVTNKKKRLIDIYHPPPFWILLINIETWKSNQNQSNYNYPIKINPPSRLRSLRINRFCRWMKYLFGVIERKKRWRRVEMVWWRGVCT